MWYHVHCFSLLECFLDLTCIYFWYWTMCLIVVVVYVDYYIFNYVYNCGYYICWLLHWLLCVYLHWYCELEVLPLVEMTIRNIVLCCFSICSWKPMMFQCFDTVVKYFHFFFFLWKSPVLKRLFSRITLLFTAIICKALDWLTSPSLLIALCESSRIVPTVPITIPTTSSPVLHFACHNSSGIWKWYFLSFSSFLWCRYSLLDSCGQVTSMITQWILFHLWQLCLVWSILYLCTKCILFGSYFLGNCSSISYQSY